MPLRTLDRANAARYSLLAIAPLALGVGAALWILQSEPVDHQGRVDTSVKVYVPPSTGTPQPGPADEADEGPTRGAEIAARFDAIKNRPVPITPDPVIPDTTEPPLPGPEITGDIKYVGPVRLGPIMLAVMNIEGKQQAVGKGKSISYTVDSTAHVARVKAVTETEVTLEENGVERVIAKADDSGERITFVGGNRPTRTKAVSMKKKNDSRAGHPLDANASAEYLAKKNEALASMAPMLDRIAKEKSPEVASRLREKMISTAKAKGLDPSVIEEEVERIKESGGEK